MEINMRESVHGGDIYSHAGVLDFSANINPLGIPDKVLEVAKDSIALSVYYPDIECRKLRRRLSETENISEHYILFGNGAADLIFSFVSAIKPKKAVLIAPSFAEYETALKTASCEIVYYELEEKKEFIIEENLIEYITDETDVVFLCNPNNPTGQLTKKEILIKIADHCRKCNCFFVLDECFNDFLEYPHKYSMKSEICVYSNLVILKAFTKLYAMPGLRLGYCLSSNTLLLEQMKECVQPWNISVPAQEAGLAALDEEIYVERTRNLIKKEREYLIKELKQMGISVIGSKANYIFFYSKKELYQTCLEKKFLIRDCSNYRGLRTGYYRIAVKKRDENKKLIEVLKTILG